MQAKTLNTIVIVIGIIYAVACSLTPQKTLHEYEPLILLCFGLPYGFLFMWAMFKTEKEKEKKGNE
jgi:hypothetical protein